MNQHDPIPPKRAGNPGRDNFSEDTKEKLRLRVGGLCSNPECRKATSGPHDDPAKAVNTGVASHICAAKKGGPRWDQTMSPAMRKHATNGIWLCTTCGKLIDNDVITYPATRLKAWKKEAEDRADAAIRSGSSIAGSDAEDVKLLRYFATCLERPAFQKRFEQEGSMEALDKAVEDTITAINTGCLRDREGRELARAHGKAFLTRADWKQEMNHIVDLLGAMRDRYRAAVEAGVITTWSFDDGRVSYYVKDRELSRWMDDTRRQAVGSLSALLTTAGIPPVHNHYE